MELVLEFAEIVCRNLSNFLLMGRKVSETRLKAMSLSWVPIKVKYLN